MAAGLGAPMISQLPFFVSETKMPPGPSARPAKVLFACVAENRPEWAEKAHGLAFSIRTLGGTLAESPIVVHFVGDPSPELARPLERLGAEIRVVKRLDQRNAFANKLRMLEMDEHADFDVLAALDCDVAVLGDFADRVPTAVIGAKPADYDY